jgi:hypothetical protein
VVAERRSPHSNPLGDGENRALQHLKIGPTVEQKGLDPRRAEYPYDYYDKNIPPGWAGVYNAPGYYGNGLATKVAPREVKPRSPYTQQHSPGVGRTYNPDPIYANGGSYMMYKGHWSEGGDADHIQGHKSPADQGACSAAGRPAVYGVEIGDGHRDHGEYYSGRAYVRDPVTRDVLEKSERALTEGARTSSLRRA